MTASAGAPRRRTTGAVLVVVFVVIVTAAIASVSGTNGRPLDPQGVGPSGLKGVRDLVAVAGGTLPVTSDELDDRTDVAFVVRDDLSDERVDDLDAWVRAGGVLVLAAPQLLDRGLGDAPLEQDDRLFGPSVAATVTRASCDLAALQGLERLFVGGATVLLPPDYGDHRCFAGAGTGAFVVSLAVGEGTIVVVASPDLFTNEHLDREDNAALAVSLLAPAAGTRGAFVQPRPDEDAPAAAGPDAVLAQVWTTPAKVLLAQGVVAFALYAWWRGRRVGRPVDEPLPVQIAGSELTEAVGQLLARTHHPERAATLLRRDLRRELGVRLGLPVDAPVDVFAEAVAARTPTTWRPDQIATVLTDTVVSTDQELLALAARIDHLREEALHGPDARTPVRH